MGLTGLGAVGSRVFSRKHRHPLRIAARLRVFGILLCAVCVILAPFDTVLNLSDELYANNAVPRTHPLTWLCLALSLGATVLQRPLRLSRPAEQGLWWAVIAIASTTALTAMPIKDALYPYDLGVMGSNTSAGFLCLALGQLLRQRAPVPGVVLAALAIWLPAVSINGLSMGKQEFYGAMAVATSFGLLGLALANLARYARRAPVRFLLQDTPASHLVRQHVLVWGLLAALMPVGLRFVEMTKGASFAALYTAQMSVVLVGVLYFGGRFSSMLDRTRRVQKKIMRDAETDELTGAALRRVALDHYERMNWRGDTGIIVLDIDHFKAVNDTHGHAVGDDVLRVVTKVLRQELRLSDVLIRWGGEELLILLPIPSQDALLRRAEDLRGLVERVSAETPGIPRVTASLGVTLVPRAVDADFLTAFKCADDALYSAKTRGRNRVAYGSLRHPGAVQDLSGSAAAA